MPAAVCPCTAENRAMASGGGFPAPESRLLEAEEGPGDGDGDGAEGDEEMSSRATVRLRRVRPAAAVTAATKASWAADEPEKAAEDTFLMV